jgi:hypothetical protein
MAGGAHERTRALAGLVLILVIVGAAFFLVGKFAARGEGFDWELASIFGTAVGTVLLAAATGFLAWVTRGEVVASRQELELSRSAFQASTRPILLDAPLDVFLIERNPAGFQPLLVEGPAQRTIDDLGRIMVEAGQYSTRTDAQGYVSITVPLHNVGAGLALIHDARIIGFDPGWTIHWRRRSMQSGVPPGQLSRISFNSDLDPGDGEALSIELQDLDEPISFSIEVVYSDFSGGQRTRTRLAIEGRGSTWRVTDVDLFDSHSEQAFVSLHREATVITGPSAEEPRVEGA